MYVHAYTKTKNDESARAVGAIALYPCGNTQSGWYFMSLRTGKRIRCYKWTVAPICDRVIKRVHQLADLEKGQTALTNGELEFKWRPDQDEMTFSTEEATSTTTNGDEYDIVPSIQEIPDDYATPIAAEASTLPEIEHEKNNTSLDEVENLVANNGMQQENPSVKIKERTSASAEHITETTHVKTKPGILVEELEEVPSGLMEGVDDEEENLACSDQVNILPQEDIIEESETPPLMDRNTPNYDSDDVDEVKATTAQSPRSKTTIYAIRKR